METLTFKLQEDNFEGPLDLLLYLVGKNKMNLYDINIMELIEQYTAAIQTMQADKLEVSSEFIDMAAHLVQMKSALLLPRSPEAERMKAELTGRLIEYSTCKQVAAELGSRARDLYTAVRQPQKPEGPAEYSRKQDPDRLVQAWFSLMGRSQRRKKPTQERFEPLVTAPFVSVASRVAHMLRGMLKGTLCRMGQLFSPQESRSTNVATFLALLELIRAGRVRLDETGTLTMDRARRRATNKTNPQERRPQPMPITQRNKIGMLEAMLFANAEPVETDRLAEAMRADPAEVLTLLEKLQKRYDETESGLMLLHFDGDRWQMATRPYYGEVVKRILDTRRNAPLSPAALEVLAIIAYNQPVSRSFIEQVRGVDSSSTVSKLMERGLIEEAGRLDLPGKPVAFRVTDTFLRVFGLGSLADLPPLHDDPQKEEELPVQQTLEELQ